ncbi:MAG: hypothetical protein CR217_06045 [Beijerinckiaceae bacterium]|nr:MAG: hypothetical protein CR217_06045 [Beijerinckiaceae bacterium]
MFTNPTVQDFIDRELGGPTPLSRPPPPTPGYRGSLARALLGDVTMPRIGAPPAVPAIRPGRGLEPPLPSVGVNRGPSSQASQEVSGRPPSVGIGSSGLTSGLEKLGTGISGAIGNYAASRAQQQTAIANAAGLPGAPVFGLPPSPAFGGSAGATIPSFARPGIGTGPIGSSIGGVDGLPQFLNGIKAGEAVPYSGQSSTGAIGAYGLTGDFIKQYAPSAGLPTDRASYMNNPDLQDKLAATAATQMYNQFGSWPSVANAWLTGSPTATTSAPGNMSPSAYVAKVMRAANMSAADQLQDQQQDTYQTPQAPPSSQGQQPVIPGQGNPHMPGFDPTSVPFTNTPIGQQSMLQPPPPNALTAALAGQGAQGANAPPALAPGIVAALDNLFGGGQFGAG